MRTKLQARVPVGIIVMRMEDGDPTCQHDSVSIFQEKIVIILKQRKGLSVNTQVPDTKKGYCVVLRLPHTWLFL